VIWDENWTDKRVVRRSTVTRRNFDEPTIDDDRSIARRYNGDNPEDVTGLFKLA
jgi:hypothetical protein